MAKLRAADLRVGDIVKRAAGVNKGRTGHDYLIGIVIAVDAERATCLLMNEDRNWTMFPELWEVVGHIEK